MGVFFASRDAVMDAADQKASAYTSSQIDRLIDSSSRAVESLIRKTCVAPTIATRSWPWPNSQNATSKLWLDGTPLLSLTTLTSGGQTIPPAGYYLEPDQYGPPYYSIEINQGSNYMFAGGSSGPQRSITVTGVFGESNDERAEGVLGAALSTTTGTTLLASKNIGVGSVLRVDAERMIITDKSFVSSGQTGTLAASAAAQTLAVADGTQFTARESLLIDAERLLIVDIAGNNLIVKRMWSGTTLAAHTTAPIFWARSMTVTRGALGTTAATHLVAAPAVRWVVPGLIEQLTVAYTLAGLQNEANAYGPRTGSNSGSGGGEMPITNASLIAQLEKMVIAAYGRPARMRAV